MASTTGFGHLLKFILKRDTLWLPAWILGLFALGVSFIPLMPSILVDDAAKLALQQTMLNPAMVAICGPAYGSTTGAIFSQFMLVWEAILVALMNIMFVVRHTRKDEEEGRNELLAALPVARNANLLAVLAVAFAANLVLALLLGLCAPVFGVEAIDLPGSLAYGFALGSCGLVFAALTAVFAQIFSTSKGAMGLALAMLGGSYLLRATGDMAVSGASELNLAEELMALVSPLGLIERSQLFVNNYVWPEIILLAAALMLGVLAFVLGAIRSSGQGMLPARRGRSHASVVLRGELGLAWRLTRTTIIAWAVVVFVFSASYGSIFNDIGTFMESNEMYKAIFLTGEVAPSEIMKPIIATLVLIMSVIAAMPVAQVAQKLIVEEGRGRMEQLLAKASSRYYVLGCYALLSFVLAFAMQALTALGFWVAVVSVMAEPIDFEVFFSCAMSYLPAVLVFAGLGVFVVGVAPKARVIVWAYTIYAFFVSFLGGMFNMPEWAQNISVFSLLPRYPAEALEPAVIVGLCAAALVLAGVGITAYRRHDISG